MDCLLEVMHFMEWIALLLAAQSSGVAAKSDRSTRRIGLAVVGVSWLVSRGPDGMAAEEAVDGFDFVEPGESLDLFSVLLEDLDDGEVSLFEEGVE